MFRTLALLLLTASVTSAADDPKAAAEANLKKVGATKFTTAETDDVFVIGTIPDGKAKPIAEQAQKALTYARTALKFDAKDALWSGKLTVYVFADGGTFASFARQVEQRRPDKQAWYGLNHRAEPPYVAVGPEPGEKQTDADVQADAAAVVGAAVLSRKAAATPSNPLPEWLSIGFGRAAHARAAGGTRLADYRKMTKAAVIGTKTKPALTRVQDVLDGVKGKDSEWVSASLAEYLAFGPEAGKFSTFLGGFKGSDNNQSPTVADAMAAAEWKPDWMDGAWKKWVATAK